MLVKNKYLDVKSHTFVFMFNAKYQAMEYHDARMFMQTRCHQDDELVITCQDGVLQVVPVPMFRKISQVFGWKF